MALNVEYNVLICLGSGCQHALKPTTISRHLDIKHKTPLELRKQVDEYIRDFPFTYDYASIQLPENGLAPQPIVPIVDGLEYRDCQFKSVNWSVIRQHANKVHSKKDIANEDVFRVVRLQSWFREKRERY
jgi:hypothetical protein